MTKKGFTLIELAVALSVMVVLGGIVVVRVKGWSPRQRLNASARALGNTIRTFREKAEYEQARYVLSLDLEAGAYTVFGPSGDGTAEGRKVRRNGRLDAGQSFEKVTVSGSEREATATLVFEPRGVLPETRIAIANDGGDRVELRLRELVNEVDYADQP